jgi:hypothetical protein
MKSPRFTFPSEAGESPRFADEAKHAERFAQLPEISED